MQTITAKIEAVRARSQRSGARWTLRNLDGKVVREYDSFGPTTGMEYFQAANAGLVRVNEAATTARTNIENTIVGRGTAAGETASNVTANSLPTTAAVDNRKKEQQ